MGVSTNAQICFGVTFEEGYEFPWDEDEYEDIDDWWRDKICGYKPSRIVFTEEGEYLKGVSKVEVEAYFVEKLAFEKAHPLPVSLVSHCSAEDPMYILAVPRTCMSAHRGDTQSFQPDELTVTIGECAALLEFCKTHGLTPEGEPGWWLTSYWG